MVSDDEKAMFRRAMAAVTPLKKTSDVHREPTKPPADRTIIRPDRPQPTQANTIPSDLPLSSFYTTTVQAHSILSYSEHQIPGKRMRELRQGLIPRDARLDLHGFKPEQAQQALLTFINDSIQRNHRCLLIIHGKGSRGGEAPVLKNLVNHWLRQLPQVLAFHSAVARDGGSGALYVLLKRNRTL